VKRIIKCPKCGSNPIRYDEIWDNAVINFDAETFKPIGHGMVGDPSHVMAECSCGYSWRLKKVHQITDVVKICGKEKEWEEQNGMNRKVEG
jgi:hypothetical protein